MKPKKIPLRTCVVSKEKLPKKELIRVVKTKDGEVFVDETSKMNGKGAYLKKDLDIINKAEKNKILDRILEIEIPVSIYEDLKKLL